MEFTGRIKQMLPMRQGTSQRTGNEWYAQPFVFEYFEHETDRYADSVVLETYDANIIPHLKEGLELRIGFSHKAKPIKKQDGTDTIINEMRVYKIESVKHAQGANQPAGGANASGVADNGDPAVIGPQSQQKPAEEDPNDDLPF